MNPKDLKESLIKVVRLLDKGIAMEMHARDFYAAAARKTGSPQGRKLFEWLAQFEVGHKARLEGKRKEILSHPALKGVETKEVGDYDVSEADESVALPSNPTDIDILKIALENERRAYAFYQKKITFSTDALLKEMFNTMAREEERHIKILSDQRKHLEVNRIWGDLQLILGENK